MRLPLVPISQSDFLDKAVRRPVAGVFRRRADRVGALPSRSLFDERGACALIIAIGLGLSFFALAWLGIFMTREMGRIAAVWLANGVAVAVILRSPRAFAPLLAAAVFSGNIAANLAHQDPLSRALLLASANLIEIGIVVAIMRSRLTPRTAFDTGPVIGRYMGAALAGATVAGLFASTGLATSEGALFGDVLLHWVTADVLGLLIVGTLLLSVPTDTAWWKRTGPMPPLTRRLEQAGLVASVIGATLLLFVQNQAPLLFLIGPLLVLCAFRLSLSLASFAILVSSAFAVGATLYGLGPVARYADEPITQIYALQSLIASMIALVLPVRALIVERDRLGVAFAQSERKFMRMAEASTAGVLHLNLQGDVTWANQRWFEMTGDPGEGGEPAPWMQVVAEGERRALATLWTEARATLEPMRGEFAASPRAEAAHDIRWFRISIHPERMADGDLSGFVVRTEDITQRREAEDALAQSERLYRLVTEHVDDIVIRLGLDGTMQYVSSAAQRILGFAPSDLAGRPMRDLVHGEDWPECRKALTNPGSFSSAYGRVRPEIRYRHRCSDGSFRWVEAKFRPIFDQTNGEAVEFVASIRDISRRHRTEQVISESAAKLRESNRLILLAEDLAKVGHWRLDLERSEFDYSLQINAIVGVSRRDTLSARMALRLVTPADRGTLLATLARARRAERPCECEVRLATPAGELREVRVVIQADRAHSGQLQSMFGVVRDVTVENRAKAELVRARDRAHEAAQAKAHFLATMSHEIRTPMTGVMGMIDLLMAQPDDQDRTRYLDMLRTSADLLMAVLDDILDFSKIDSGQLRLERREFLFDRMVEDCVSLFEREARAKGVGLRLETPGEPIAVRGDAMRLRQVLCNLLSNAVKFTDHGNIAVRVHASIGDDRTALRLEVEDDGVGIDPEMQAQLFDPFVQADASTSRRFGGTGLGLAICRRLVDAMGGRISVDSRLGDGATFRVDMSLPTATASATLLAPDGQGAMQGRSRLPSPSAPRGLSILVAEDNPVNQMLVGAMLRADGHHVTAVENGRLAVEAANRTAYDAIIMDMQMPEMDGLAATRAIRASGGPCAAIPILALTADASPERRRFYDGAGLSAFLTKPIDQEMLLDHLRSIAKLGAVDAAPPEAAVDPAQAPSADPPPPADREPLFDDRQLAALRSAVGDVRLEQMFDLLDIELQQRPAEILAALEQGDVEAACRIAHSLKGAAGSAGALAVAAAAAGIEQAGDASLEAARALSQVATRTRKAIAALSERPDERAVNG